MKSKVGFIGLGLMGNPMAKNILKNHFPLFVYNRNKKKTEELKKLGATICQSPSELARYVDVIITMVTGPEDVKQVIFGKNGIIHGAKKQQIVIDMSTIGQKSAKEIGSSLAKYQIDFLDAPVTGSTPKAITGELTIFIGGEKSTYQKAKSVLMAMGKNHHYMGGVGSGQAVKLINNHLIAANVAAISEGMLLADLMGLSRDKVTHALETSPIMSPQLNLIMLNYVTNNFPLRFSIENLKKDLNLAINEIKGNKKSFALLNSTYKLYKKAVQQKLNQYDYSAVIKVLTVK